MRANRKTFFKVCGTLTSPTQPVRANGVTSAEITHFPVGPTLAGHLKCFLEVPGISQVYLWTCPPHVSAAIVPLPPTRCPLSHYS